MLRFIVVLVSLYSCTTTSHVNYEKEKNDILALNARQRENHFMKNAKAIADLSSDSFLVVDGGKISRPQRATHLKNFESYFSAVDFIQWDDVREPEIRFSKDASVAYVAVEKIVILKGKGASGREVIDTSHFAWISIYKKTRSGWELDAIASTRKPKS